MGAEEIAPRIRTAAEYLVRWRSSLDEGGWHDSLRRHEITIGCYSSYAHFGAQLEPSEMLLKLGLIIWRRIDQYTSSVFAITVFFFSYSSMKVQQCRGQYTALVGEKRCCDGVGLLQ